MNFSSSKCMSFVVILLFLVFMAGCAGVHPHNVKTPHEERLRARVSQFHDVLGLKDINAWYAMTTPTIRSKMTLEEFKKDFRWDENEAKTNNQKMRGEFSKVCSCLDMGYIRCVIIVDVTITQPDQPSTIERPLEMWEYADGDWYWGLIGHDSRGRCPGE
jgi:hypothetical protein